MEFVSGHGVFWPTCRKTIMEDHVFRSMIRNTIAIVP